MFKIIVCITLAFYLYASICEKSVNSQTVPPEECPSDQDQLTLTARDQRSYIAVSVGIGTDLITVKRTLRKVFGKNVHLDRRMEVYYQEFNERNRLTTDRCPCSRKPFTCTDENHEEVLNELMSHRRTRIIDELVDAIRISRGSLHVLLRRGNYKNFGAYWLPHELYAEDIRLRIKACRDNLRWFQRYPQMLGHFIAIDKTWIRSYSPLVPQGAREWDSLENQSIYV